MKILCQERYDKAVAYAKEIKNDTLQKCIDRLKQWEENPNCPCEIELYYDSAPHSFGFRQVYPDGRTGIVGGLLYHGQPDQSFAVLMNPIHGWSIHKKNLEKERLILLFEIYSLCKIIIKLVRNCESIKFLS